MLVDPGPLVYRGSLTATHTAQAVGSFRRKCAAEGCTGAAWQRRARKAINGSTRNVEVACVPAGTGEGCRAVPDGWSRVGLTGPRC